jgi:ribonuclease HI
MISSKPLPSYVIAHADGGSRGNPGPSASGWVIQDPLSLEVLADGGEFLGITTNNQAEYRAVLDLLKFCLQNGIQELDIRLDSLLVVNQVNGLWKVKNRDLWPIYEEIKELCKKFKSIKFTHVLREFNKLADAKANQIMDSAK